jgi:hypothetical protein
MIEFESVPLPVARRVLVGSAPAAAPGDWTSRRAVRKDELLLPSAAQWLDALPADVAPRKLALLHPRIANRICDLWDKPLPCASLLADLLIVRRHSRKGFPLDVAMEIASIAAYYEKLHPPGRPWL